MEHFVTLERAIACPRASVAVAADTAAQVLSSAGYRRGLGFGPTQSYVRAYRPTWALVLAVVLAVPTVGVGLLLLLVRTKDHCNVVIEDGPYGVVALVSGRVPASLPAALEAATGTYPESQGHNGQSSQPPPMLLAPSAGGGGYEGTPPRSAILRPATPVPGVHPEQGSPQGVNGQQYGNPQQYGGPPQYGGQPQYGQQYGQPRYGQPPPYAQPQQGQPQYGQAAQYEQPQYGPPQHPGPQQPGPPSPGPAEQQGPPPEQAPAPVAFRPPSRLAPPMPADPPSGAGANGSPAPPVNGSAPAAPAARASDDDPFSSTSGRVPWAVAGGRSPSLPSPGGPPPVSPPAWSPDLGAAVAAASGAGGGPAAPGGPGGGHGGGQGGSVGRGPALAPQPGGVATAVGDSGYVLRVDSGEALELGPFCLLGREPVARDGDPPAIFVRFDDVKLSVSKTHIAYGVDERGLWVMDRNSTNGTTVIEPSGRRVPCAPGAREYLEVGAQVQIGQRRLTVEGPGGSDGPAHP